MKAVFNKCGGVIQFEAVTNACATAPVRSSQLPFGFRLVVLPRYYPQQDGQIEAY